MKVVFVGAGNVATNLAIELYRLDFDIVQVYSRTQESADELAHQVKAIATTNLSNIIDSADLYIFSVKDAVLKDVLSQIPHNKGLWIHTAGSLPLSILEGFTEKYGVFYPLQTFSKGRNITWKNIPIFVEASDIESEELLMAIAKQLSEKVAILSSDLRQYVHLTGVFACNFVNHMYALSAEVLKKANLTFDVALPLIDETASKVHEMNPEEAQTGPAVRYDENVMNKHLAMLDNDKMADIYRLISDSIHQASKNKKKQI